MQKSLILHEKDRKRESYIRRDLRGDVLYNSFFHRDFQIFFAKKTRKTSVVDNFALFMLQKRLLSQEELVSYSFQMEEKFPFDGISKFDDFSVEELYAFLVCEREKILGSKRLKKACLLAAEESRALSFDGGLDDTERIARMCDEKGLILIALTEAALFATAKEWVSRLSENKNVAFLASEDGSGGLFSSEELCHLFGEEIELFHLTERGFVGGACLAAALSDIALLVFGESGLLDCRDLAVPCGVFAEPRGYFASAVAGQLGVLRPAAVLVPRGFSVTSSVPLTSPSRFNYLILSKLAKTYGEKVCSLSPEELYGRYPRFFFNVYENSPEFCSEEIIPEFSPEEKPSRSFSELDALRKQAIFQHLEGMEDCEYYAKLFTREETPEIQGKILVHGFKVKNCSEARVIPCGKEVPFRKKIRELPQEGTALVSNFLFFLTPKLANLYNTLRSDRKEEQAVVNSGHLDYLLEKKDGARKESFPLFRKTCIAMKDDGEVLFFNFRLGGGKIRFGEEEFSWKKQDVDPSFQQLPPVCVFTPYLSLPDADADRESYRKTVGEDRVNFVLIQDRVIAIRCGDVVLPGMGVVLSLSRELGELFLEKKKLFALGNGYYSPEKLSFSVELDPPEEIEKEEWDKVRWAYGGGLSLILDGVGLCDGEDMEEWFARDGWTSPLSRQTQESVLHSLIKHPRTAVGTTDKGELVVLVFSGRTGESDGADYKEMCFLARKIVPEIRYLMNVDGGGSAVLGMVYRGSFTELSLPSTSTGNTVGMVRPINTALFVPLKKKGNN